MHRHAPWTCVRTSKEPSCLPAATHGKPSNPSEARLLPAHSLQPHRLMPATSYISIRKSPSKPHRCRVRRKRQRLRSNGPIGSDPAFSLIPLLKLCRAGLLPIESYRQGGPIRLYSQQMSATGVIRQSGVARDSFRYRTIQALWQNADCFRVAREIGIGAAVTRRPPATAPCMRSVHGGSSRDLCSFTM